MIQYLDRSEFVQFAPDQPGTSRVNHTAIDCQGSSKSLAVTRREDGSIHARCFRCGKYGKYSDRKVYTKVNKRLGVYSNERMKSVSLPSDVVTNMQLWDVTSQHKARSYLITQEDISNYGICYSQSYNRVIFPVYRSGELKAYQARSYSETPKYFTRASDTTELYIHLHNGANVFCVVVEDMYSAIRCARYTNALALLGNSLSEKALEEITRTYRKFLIYLDQDNRAVRMNSLKIRNRLTALGCCAAIPENVDRDPKEETEESLYLRLSKYLPLSP